MKSYEELYDKYRNKQITYCELCELIEEHERKLEAKRKYKQGEPIKNLEELLRQELVFIYGKPKHIEFVKSQTFRMILMLIDNKKIYKAIKKEKQDENNQRMGYA